MCGLAVASDGVSYLTAITPKLSIASKMLKYIKDFMEYQYTVRNDQTKLRKY